MTNLCGRRHGGDGRATGLLLILAISLLCTRLVWAQERVELDRIEALVNDDVITKTELDKQVATIELQLQRQNTRMPPADVLRKQVLERLVVQRIQLQLAELGGIRIDDQAINEVLNKLAAENGITLMQLPSILAREGIEFADFRQNIRNEMTIGRLQQQQVISKVTVTEQEVENFLTNAATRRGTESEYRIGHILIAIPEGATPDEIAAKLETAQAVVDDLRSGADFGQTAVAVSDGQKALEGGDLGWRAGSQLPTVFADAIPRLSLGQIAGPIRSPSGFHIVKLIDSRSSAQVRSVTETLVRHILVKTNQVVSDSDAQQKLAQLRERIIAGDDFAALARTHSDDQGSAIDGGSLGWSKPGTMVPEFEEVMTRTAPGSISQPFRSRFGWHVLQVMARRTIEDSGEVERAQAREAIHQRKAEEAVQAWLRRIRDEAYVEYRTGA